MILIIIGTALISFGIGYLTARIIAKKQCAEKLEALRISFKTEDSLKTIEELIEEKEKIRKEIEEEADRNKR